MSAPALSVSTALLVSLPWGLGACDSGETTRDGIASGARVGISVAALSLSGLTNACYTLTVTNGLSEVVWSRSNLCADDFGDGAGAVTFVGPCDASPGAEQHTVSVEIEGLYDAAGLIAPDDYQDPGVLTQMVSCAANADTPVSFDVVLLRRAEQGFFDVAVTFDDIFCSAKLDCTDSSGATMALLFDETGARSTTIVSALACTSGVGGGSTYLYRSPLVLDCPAPFVDVTLDPSLGPGSALPSASAGPVFQYAVYEGTEALTSGGASLSKHYWNVAIGLDLQQLPDGCRLVATATASDGPFIDGTSPIGAAYPVIDTDVIVTAGGDLSCGRHPLGSAEVSTRYARPSLPETFSYVFDGTHSEPLLTGSGLSALDPGLTCATILADFPSSPDSLYFIDPNGGDPRDAFQVYCDMTTDEGGWTLLITYAASATPFSTVALWPATFALTGAAPDATGMYKGSLAGFSEVREEVNSGANTVWAAGLTEAELNKIRDSYGYVTRLTSMPTFADVPSCRVAYATATDDISGCTPYSGGNGDTITGFQVDVYGTSHCWFSRGGGTYAGYQGSARCFVGGDPNGSRWARTWFR